MRTSSPSPAAPARAAASVPPVGLSAGIVAHFGIGGRDQSCASERKKLFFCGVRRPRIPAGSESSTTRTPPLQNEESRTAVVPFPHDDVAGLKPPDARVVAQDRRAAGWWAGNASGSIVAKSAEREQPIDFGFRHGRRRTEHPSAAAAVMRVVTSAMCSDPEDWRRETPSGEHQFRSAR